MPLCLFDTNTSNDLYRIAFCFYLIYSQLNTDLPPGFTFPRGVNQRSVSLEHIKSRNAHAGERSKTFGYISTPHGVKKKKKTSYCSGGSTSMVRCN